MTGPEHYRESEALLAEGVRNESWNALHPVYSAAQVHATLALAAATAARGGMKAAAAWQDATT